MAESKQISLIDVLTEEGLTAVGAKLAGLPDRERFREQVERDLWETLVGANHQDADAVDYESLPDVSKSVIGYVERGEGEQETPWWLTSFEWQAQSRGETVTLKKGQYSDSLADFENFDPAATQLQRPELQESTFLNALDHLKELCDALDEGVGINEDDAEFRLPSDIFTVEEKRIETTDQFEQWFNALLQLCPPVNDVLTALLMVNTGVTWEAAEGVISGELVERLETLGFSGQRIYEHDYFSSLKRSLELDGVFDLRIPRSDDYEELGALEAMLYEVWAERNQERTDEVGDWLERASDWRPELDKGEEPMFAQVAFTTPLRLSKERPVYMTLRAYAPSTDKSGYYTRDRGKLREIKEIMRSNGFLE